MLLASVGTSLTTTAALNALTSGADTITVGLIKIAWLVISTYLLPKLLSFVHNDFIRQALSKGAETFILSEAEGLVADANTEAGLKSLLSKFQSLHPVCKLADEKLVRMALQAALNKLTTTLGSRDLTPGKRVLLRNGASNS